YTVTLDATGGSQFYRLAPGQGFGAGETTKTIVVPIVGDLLDEPDETFFLKLSNAGNAVIACAQAVGTIIDDDARPALAINHVSVTEGNGGPTNPLFTVSLGAASGQTITVNYATADGTATAGLDYVSTNGVLTFLPGETSKTITVAVKGDLLDEQIGRASCRERGEVTATTAAGKGDGTMMS